MNREPRNLAVVDFETTGFRSKTDRIVEVGVVFVDPETMEIVEEWDTLINPLRDVGPTQVHGITASMVEMAPTFDDVAGYLCEKLHNHVLVCHNLTFDQRFLDLELSRLAIPFDLGSGYCTLRASGKRLVEACNDVGLSIDCEHSALADARATTALLPSLVDDISRTTAPFKRFDSRLSKNSRTLRRDATDTQQTIDSAWKRIASTVRSPSLNSKQAQYMYLLDYVLVDRRIDEEEEEELQKFCHELNIGSAERKALNRKYLESVVSAATRDGVITAGEHELIRNLRESLDVQIEIPEISSPPADTVALSRGLKVCFTGESVIDGEHYTRKRLEQVARDSGLNVKSSVTKSACDLLVASDAATQSSKAKSAMKYEIPIISVEQFLELVLSDQVDRTQEL